MPRTRQALDLNDAYRLRLLDVRDRTIRALASVWPTDITTYDRDIRRWLAAATQIVTAGQTHQVTLTDGFLARLLTLELDVPTDPAGLDPSRWAGRTRDGRPVARVLSLADVSVRSALSGGADPAIALDQGLARAVRVARTETMEAARSAMADQISTDERIAGWRRVTSRTPCPACLGLSVQGLRRTDHSLSIHASCSCTALPVIRDVPETVTPPAGRDVFDAMSPAEQDRLYGPERAELIRTGQVSLDDLAMTHTHPEWVDEVTAKPVSALT